MASAPLPSTRREPVSASERANTVAATDVMRRELGGERLSAPVIVLIGMCSLIYFLDGLIHSVLGPLAPDLARSLSLSNTELGPIFSANLIGQCIGLVVFPLLASRVGQRTVVLGSLVGFGLGQSASALSMGATDLFMWRLVTGLFLGGCLPQLPRHRHGPRPPAARRRCRPAPSATRHLPDLPDRPLLAGGGAGRGGLGS